jgi:hypothetical protein
MLKKEWLRFPVRAALIIGAWKLLTLLKERENKRDARLDEIEKCLGQIERSRPGLGAVISADTTTY